ncbi:MAG: hypothetical protein ACOCQR_02220 [bacterium]
MLDKSGLNVFLGTALALYLIKIETVSLGEAIIIGWLAIIGMTLMNISEKIKG